MRTPGLNIPMADAVPPLSSAGLVTLAAEYSPPVDALEADHTLPAASPRNEPTQEYSANSHSLRMQFLYHLNLRTSFQDLNRFSSVGQVMEKFGPSMDQAMERFDSYLPWIRETETLASLRLDKIRRLGFADRLALLFRMIKARRRLEDLEETLETRVGVYHRLLLEREQLLRDLTRAESFMKPDMIRGLIQSYHESGPPSPDLDLDDAIDWVLGLDVEGTEAFIQRRRESRQPRIWREQWPYDPTPYALVSSALHLISPTSEDFFYDLGSGYGRPSLFTAMVTDAGVRGIEMVPDRVEQARRAAMRLGLDNLEYLVGYADEIDYSDGTVFFLYNPFSRETLARVMKRLEAAASRQKESGRRIKVVSYGETNADFDEQKSWLERIQAPSDIAIFKARG